ncbi:hypothetical protein ACFY9C_11155 [Streptomyces filamentosus]|uniref:hypothetical protein n=1 Tax=Streptomyces filamentosus TaxID=67294 RepID=UPI0036F104AC
MTTEGKTEATRADARPPHDLVVVGAGPYGLSTAAHAAAHGLGPAGAWWLRERFAAVTDVRLGRRITGAAAQRGTGGGPGVDAGRPRGADASPRGRSCVRACGDRVRR